MRELFVGLLLAGLSVPVFAHDDGYSRNDRNSRDNRGYGDDRNDRRDNGRDRGWYKNRNRDNGSYRNNGSYRDNGTYGTYGNSGSYGNSGGYGNNGSYGNSGNYGRYGDSVIDRTLGNLSRISSRGFVDGHERDHFNKAMQNLQEFNNRYREGKFENGRLDNAIDEMKHLANAQQLNPNDRQIIAREIENLRSFRSSGGRY